MKRIQLISFMLFLAVFSLSNSYSQGISVYKMIDKSIDQVINYYGKPVHQDNSNPGMKCIFYKTKTTQIVFVADKSGVYQVEYTCDYNSRNGANSAIDSFIKECYTGDFKVDTVNVQEYNFSRKGAKMNLSLLENKYANNYKLILKANRKEN
jgi:hypothetical protein